MATITNNGRRRLGLAGRPAIILAPGETQEVSAQQYEEMKRNRIVARWFESGVLSTDGKPVEPKMELKKPEAEAEPELPDGVTGEGVETHHHGGGWWSVYVNGFEVTDTKVRKKEAQAIAAEYE